MSRRLFEQTENTDPSLLQRLGIGRSGVPTENITLGSLITWLESKLGFLKKSANLSDVTPTTARDNLGVYSISQVDGLVNNRTLIYPTAGGALKENNTADYTPTNNYHPATKKYVDDNVAGLSYKGVYLIGNVNSGVDERTITIPDQGTNGYYVMGIMYDLATPRKGQDVIWCISGRTSTSFRLTMKETAGETQNIRFEYMIYT